MSETTEAGSSPAEVVDVFNGETPTLAEYSEYRQSGELPARFKSTDQTAASVTADTQEETEETESEISEEDESESETDDAKETQEQVPDKTAKRIKQLLAERHELQRKLDAATKTDAKQESSTPEPTRTKPTPEDKNSDGTPKYKSYEDYVEELADWKAEQRWESKQREQAEHQALNALKTTLDQARERYDDADEVIFPAAQAIREAKIPLAVKEVFAQSENFIDLCYVVGSDPDELKKFIRLAESNPRAAIGKVFEYERGIKEELGKGGTERDATGKFKAPELKKTTAPKPPSTVNGTSTKAFDVSDESLSPEEWMRKRTADIERKRKA
jgi:hypothetical protein